jgi:hypothetical protein
MATHVLTVALQPPAGEQLTFTNSYTGSGEANLEESIANGATNLALSYALDVSAVKSFWASSNVALTLESNSGSAPDDTLALDAGVPYFWNTDSPEAFVFAGADIASLFATNASGAAAALKIKCVYDGTP